jgi:hypothetical protein
MLKNSEGLLAEQLFDNYRITEKCQRTPQSRANAYTRCSLTGPT